MNASLGKKLKNVKWGEFNVGDLFEVQRISRIISKKELSEDYDFPAYSSNSTNNGIVGFTNNPEFICNETTPVYLTFGDHTRTLNIAKQSFSVLDNVKVLKPLTSNENCLLFIISIWKKQIPNLGYARHWKVAKNCKIQLPLNESGQINFDFMESFISELEQVHIGELEQERINILNAYLNITGLFDYELTEGEKRILKESEKWEWKEYKIRDLYEKEELSFTKSEFNKGNDVSKTKTDVFSLPLVNAKDGNNGIMYYGRPEDFESAEMTIDIVNDGAVSTGNVYPQPHRTGVLYNAYLIKAINHKDTIESLFFVSSSIQKSIKRKYCYEFKATWDKVKKESFFLPTKSGEVDFASIESFIRAIEKLVIKDVVSYADKKNAATKEVVRAHKPLFTLAAETTENL